MREQTNPNRKFNVPLVPFFIATIVGILSAAWLHLNLVTWRCFFILSFLGTIVFFVWGSVQKYGLSSRLNFAWKRNKISKNVQNKPFVDGSIDDFYDESLSEYVNYQNVSSLATSFDSLQNFTTLEEYDNDLTGVPTFRRISEVKESYGSFRQKLRDVNLIFSIVVFFSWGTVASLAGLRYELYYNYFPKNEIGFLIPEDGVASTLKIQLLNTPCLYQHDESERVAHGETCFTCFNARAYCVKNGGQWEEASGRLAVSVDGDASFLHIGDVVVVSGRLTRPLKSANPGERDKILLYRSQRILTTLSITDVKNIDVLSDDDRSFVYRFNLFFEGIRLRAAKILQARLSPRNSAVACGMTFGFRNEVDDETNDSFRRTGTIHLLAISGLHIALVVGAFVFFLRRLGISNFLVSLTTLFLIGFYLCLTDMRAPVVRASVLIVVISAGVMWGRRSVTLNSLAFAAIFLLFINPCELFQLGAQLSFLATGVFLWSDNITLRNKAETSRFRRMALRERKQIMASSVKKSEGHEEEKPAKEFGHKEELGDKNCAERRVVEEYFNVTTIVFAKDRDEEELEEFERAQMSRNFLSISKRVGNSLGNKFWAVFKTGFCIWTVGTPLLTSTTNLLTPIALIANPIIWTPATLALLSAFLLAFYGLCAACFSIFPTCLLDVLGFATDRCFDLFLGVLDLLASSRRGAFYIASPQTWVLWTFYVPLIFWTLFPHCRPKKVTLCLAFVAWLGIALGSNYYEKWNSGRSESLRIEVFSVGHGVAILGYFSDGRTFLYDCGNLTDSKRVAELVAKRVWNLHRSKIDLVILSHADYDHYGGLVPLVETIDVVNCCVSPVMFRKNNEELSMLKETLEKKEIPITYVSGGDTLEESGFPELTVLHPVYKESETDDLESNANSVVVSLEYLDRYMLFPGDLDSVDVVFLERPSVKYDVLLAPHHGGKSENYRELLDWSQPDWVVVSGGTFQRNPTSEMELRKEGKRTLHTLDDGCVQIEIKRAPESTTGKMSVQTYRSELKFESGDF